MESSSVWMQATANEIQDDKCGDCRRRAQSWDSTTRRLRKTWRPSYWRQRRKASSWDRSRMVTHSQITTSSWPFNQQCLIFAGKMITIDNTIDNVSSTNRQYYSSSFFLANSSRMITLSINMCIQLVYVRIPCYWLIRCLLPPTLIVSWGKSFQYLLFWYSHSLSLLQPRMATTAVFTTDSTFTRMPLYAQSLRAWCTPTVGFVRVCDKFGWRNCKWESESGGCRCGKHGLLIL